MKVLKPILITLLIAGAFYGSVVLYGQLVLIKKIKHKFFKHRFSYFNFTNARLIVTLEITNTSDIDFVIKNGNFNIFMNNVFVSTVITGSSVLKKQSPATIDLQIDFNPTQVFKNAITALMSNPGNIKITVDGNVTLLSNFMILNNLKINKTFALSEIL